MKRVPMCDENCFECKFDDCIADILPKKGLTVNDIEKKRNC